MEKFTGTEEKHSSDRVLDSESLMLEDLRLLAEFIDPSNAHELFAVFGEKCFVSFGGGHERGSNK